VAFLMRLMGVALNRLLTRWRLNKFNYHHVTIFNLHFGIFIVSSGSVVCIVHTTGNSRNDTLEVMAVAQLYAIGPLPSCDSYSNACQIFP
jgi:hypothetical protein